MAAARTAGGRAAIMAVIAMSRFRRPDFAMGGPHGGAPRGPIAGGLHGGGALHFAMGGPHRGGGPHGTAAPRNAVSPWEAGAPRSAASANPWLGAIARCSRTGSSNPSPSSRQSVSRGISPSGIEKAAVAAAWVGPARWHGPQRRAGRVNITPTAGNVSVEPYSSTAVPIGGSQSGCSSAPSEVGSPRDLAM